MSCHCAVPIPEDLETIHHACKFEHRELAGSLAAELIERIARLESSLAHEQIAKLRALGQLQTAQEALARAEATIVELEKKAALFESAFQEAFADGYRGPDEDFQKAKCEYVRNVAKEDEMVLAIVHEFFETYDPAIARATGKEL